LIAWMLKKMTYEYQFYIPDVGKSQKRTHWDKNNHRRFQYHNGTKLKTTIVKVIVHEYP
jgi:hypothetical protein